MVFLARLPTTRWISTRYSSLRCFAQKASVSAVMAANFSTKAEGIFSVEKVIGLAIAFQVAGLVNRKASLLRVWGVVCQISAACPAIR